MMDKDFNTNYTILSFVLLYFYCLFIIDSTCNPITVNFFKIEMKIMHFYFSKYISYLKRLKILSNNRNSFIRYYLATNY